MSFHAEMRLAAGCVQSNSTSAGLGFEDLERFGSAGLSKPIPGSSFMRTTRAQVGAASKACRGKSEKVLRPFLVSPAREDRKKGKMQNKGSQEQ